MALRVTRPGFIEGIRALKAGQGVKDYDVNTMATRQEMRSYVCGQCHVEYYFKGPEKRLTYPWAKGLKVDEIYEYYREAGFTDFTHAESGAPALKAQHPEFEMWNQGMHARSGVACADCHMPYTREGAMKISDHHVRSPLLNINNACQTCHKWPEEELRGRVEAIQARTVGLRNRAMDALMALIADVKAAKAAGATGAPLTAALEFQRHGQFYLDFVESENSNGFHAPQEAARILGEAIDYLRQGQLALRPAPAHAPPRRPPPGAEAIMTDAVFQVPPAFDYLATVTWASSGALVGIRKHFDVVGVFVIALVSALGSGLRARRLVSATHAGHADRSRLPAADRGSS